MLRPSRQRDPDMMNASLASFAPKILPAALRFWPLLLAPLLLLPGLTGFPYPGAAEPFSDLAISHYPNALFLRGAILNSHTLPLWSPTILSGYPFAANPLAGLWYPPGWLALLLPLPLGFNLLVIAHLVWGGLGMYALLRAEGLGHRSGLLGALAFSAMPKLFAHYGAGHLTLLYAIPWTPWLLWSAARRVPGPRPLGAMEIPAARFPTGWWPAIRAALRSVLPAILLALIFLADVRWAAYAGVVWWAYVLLRLPGRSLINYQQIPHLLGQTGLAGLLAAPLALPLLEYTRLSTRAGMSAPEVLALALPLTKLLGLVFPDFGGYQEWMVYVGAAVLGLSLLPLLWRGVRRQTVFWAGVALLALLYALGDQVPFLALVAQLPGMDLLRVPSRALFVFGLALVVLAAWAVEHILAGIPEEERPRAVLMLTAVAGFGMVLAGGVWAVTGKLPASFGWGAGAGLAASLGAALCIKGKLKPNLWFGGLLLLGLLDWAVVDSSLFTTRPPDQVLAESRATAEYLTGQTTGLGNRPWGLFRTYSPSYSLEQQTAAAYGLELAGGVDPLQLGSYARFMEAAAGVPLTGYSVTLPPLSDDPASANAAFRPDPAQLGLLNVCFVAAEFDLPVEGLVLREQFGRTRVYENLAARPRAWVQPLDAAPGEGWEAVERVVWSPNRVEVQTRELPGPRLLVLSETVYPGWQVRVDGRPATIQPVAGLLRGVVLGPGAHQVTFRFRPASVYLGVGLSLAAVVGICVPPLWRRRPGHLKKTLNVSTPENQLVRPHPQARQVVDQARKSSGSSLEGFFTDCAHPDRTWVLAFAVVVMLITSLPYLLGYARQGDAVSFTGFVFGIEDGNSYIAKMLSGAHGAWLFRTPYTAYPQTGVLMFLPYLLLGKLAAAPGLHTQLVVLYHLFRFAAGILAILATYDFLACFLPTMPLRRFGLTLVTLGGGLGWVLILLGQDHWLGSLPLEFYSPETFGFLGIYGFPHLALARALSLWALLGYLRVIANSAAGRPVWRGALGCGLLWLLAGLTQPLALVVIGAVIGLHLLAVGLLQAAAARRGEAGAFRRWRQAVILTAAAAVLPGLLLLYNVVAVLTQPYLRLWSIQNRIHSPHPLHYVLAYGLLLPFVIAGVWRLRRADPWKDWLPLLWVAALPLLAYAPVDLQRRLPEAGWVALVVVGLTALAPGRSRSGNGPLLPRPALLLLLAFPSTLFLLAGGLLSAGNVSPPAFRPAAEVRAFEFLAERAEVGSVVLAAYDSGNALPAWAPLRVVIGHGPESAGLAELQPQVTAFFTAGTSDEARRTLLASQGVDYVFWGPAERRLGDWDPHQALYLRPLYQFGEYEVFAVERDGR